MVTRTKNATTSLDNMINQSPQLQQLESQLSTPTIQAVSGVNSGTRPLYLKGIFEKTKRSQVVVVKNASNASELADEMRTLVNADDVLEFPVDDFIENATTTASPELQAERVKTLFALQNDKPKILVVSVAGLRYPLSKPNYFGKSQLSFAINEKVNVTNLKNNLINIGYKQQSLVSAPGEFAMRGSIIDIYPFNYDKPIRIDLFDDVVDSLRSFDSATQRSLEQLKDAQVKPATDFLLNEQAKKGILKKLADYAKTLDESDKYRDRIYDLNQSFGEGKIPSNWHPLAKELFNTNYNLLDYVAKDGIVILDNFNQLNQQAKTLKAEEKMWFNSHINLWPFLKHKRVSVNLDFNKIINNSNRATVAFSLLQRGSKGLKTNNFIELTSHSIPQFFNNMDNFKRELEYWSKSDKTVLILANNKKRLKSLRNTLADFKINFLDTDLDNLVPNQVQLAEGIELKNGFSTDVPNLVVITENELFNKPSHRPKQFKSQSFSNAERIKTYTDLTPGDYVVHVNHGIGRYDGMQTLEVDGRHQDYLTLTYRDNGQLFIPVTQLNLIQKYVGGGDKSPRLNKLGGSEWEKTKRKAQTKIEDIADDLIDLYAKRKKERGFAFPKDDNYQREFENDFIYPETPDQLKSATEIKHDMEKPQPMERLLVGDVGFGKTEVALRAAFKAVNAGKQVAFLAPTTILSQQHYETILERFSGYPVKVAVLSRFQTKEQLKNNLEKIKNGDVDIVVGTHRLLSKDVSFKDLGLLIVDEEQRFGVKDKEKIKELRANVDVLTLTATPIPRTLNMSMTGVRQLSLIETPPPNRFPIQTNLVEKDDNVIANGIRKELARGGQVFYLHNRVRDIESTVKHLKELVPEARVGYIHGKMNENQLETMLNDFINRKYDVLVTTTIIEAGVDIPNVNSLFVENADRIGLSQLYQIRGRIGRSNRVGHAYLMYEADQALTEHGEKRLEALRDFTGLGSGFKIAMRDLSLRGAGTLLGSQQHGFVDSVGYDMYTKMLDDAVKQKQGKKQIKLVNSEISLQVEAYLPANYIKDNRQKIELYKRLKQVRELSDLREISSDIKDRFGKYPLAVEQLLLVTEIRILCQNLRIKKLKLVNNKLEVFTSDDSQSIEAIKKWDDFLVKGKIGKLDGKISDYSDKGLQKIKVKATLPKQTDKATLQYLKQVLERVDR